MPLNRWRLCFRGFNSDLVDADGAIGASNGQRRRRGRAAAAGADRTSRARNTAT
jgi:hypothetical protein